MARLFSFKKKSRPVVAKRAGLIGAIDSISEGRIGGWLSTPDYAPYTGRLKLSCGKQLISLPPMEYTLRPDVLVEGKPATLGFWLDLPPVFDCDELLDAKIVSEDGESIEVWSGLFTAGFPPQVSIVDQWNPLFDKYFIQNYLCLPAKSSLELLVLLLNRKRSVLDPILSWELTDNSLIEPSFYSSDELEVRPPFYSHVSEMLEINNLRRLVEADPQSAVNVFRHNLVSSLFKVPFDYEKYLANCNEHELATIRAHQLETGYDILYCAFVHHFHSPSGRATMDRVNVVSTAMVEASLVDNPATSSAIELSGAFRENAFANYDLGLRHFISHGQYEAGRLNVLAPPPSKEVFALADKLRQIDPEIPDARDLPVVYWSRDRSQKILHGATKLWRAKEAGKAVLPIFMPWFSYGGSDKETLLIAQAVRQEFGDAVEIVFVLGRGGAQEVRLYREKFNVLFLHPDDFTGDFFVDRAIERIIVGENVKCVLNSNSLDFWRFFSKNPRMVAALTDVLTMTFCDDINEQTKARDGWLRRFFKHVAPHNTLLISDNDRQVTDYKADFYGGGDLNFRTLHYPVDVERVKDSYQLSGAPKILWASRLDEQKGVDVLCSVARLLPECEFHVYGSVMLSRTGHAVSILQSLDNVVLHGEYSDLTKLPIETFDLFLYTALWDGLPNVLLEMGALGLPLVSSMVGGIAEILNADNSYPVHDHLEPREYVAQIHAALADEALRARKANKLSSDIAEKHSWAGFRADVRQIFQGYFR